MQGAGRLHLMGPAPVHLHLVLRRQLYERSFTKQTDNAA